MVEKHFTYSGSLDKEHLKQGDILKKTDKLKKLLEQYHSYYASSEDYSHFQVLTQSCDLVRRGKKKNCSSQYITLAAVRSLDTVIKRIVEHYADKRTNLNGDICCSDKHKDKLRSEIASLYNNQNKNYFFLKASPEDGLTSDKCTFLYLSIAIRAKEHYDLCLDGKLLELKENFRAKLGWMVGNLYSRVGTEDYVPNATSSQESFNELIIRELERHILWIPDRLFQEFKKACNNTESEQNIQDVIKNAENQLEQKRSQRINSLAGLLKGQADLSREQEKQILTFLRSPQGSAFLK